MAFVPNRDPLNYGGGDANFEFYKYRLLADDEEKIAIFIPVSEGGYQLYNLITAVDVDTGLGMETYIEGDVLYHPTTRGLPQLIADFRTSILIRDDVVFRIQDSNLCSST